MRYTVLCSAIWLGIVCMAGCSTEWEDGEPADPEKDRWNHIEVHYCVGNPPDVKMKSWESSDDDTLIRLKKQFVLIDKSFMSVVTGSYVNRVAVSLEDGTANGTVIYMYLRNPDHVSYHYPSQLEYVYSCFVETGFVEELKRTITGETGDKPLFGWEKARTEKWSVVGTWDPYE